MSFKLFTIHLVDGSLDKSIYPKSQQGIESFIGSPSSCVLMVNNNHKGIEDEQEMYEEWYEAQLEAH